MSRIQGIIDHEAKEFQKQLNHRMSRLADKINNYQKKEMDKVGSMFLKTIKELYE